MSTTVTYKGNTLTTVTNDTATLETSGTWLEDDITLTDVSTIPTGTKSISITSNGTTTEDVTNYASASITANVPNTYSAGDEGKVVSSGALVAQTSDTFTTNNTYDTTTISSVTVNVSGGGGVTQDENGYIVLPSTGGGGGGGDDAYKFIDDSFSGDYVNNSITKLRNYAFNYYTGHDFTFSSSSATSIGYNVFQGSNITSFSAPNLSGTTNNASAFNAAKKLTFLDLGTLGKIASNFAYNANKLTTIVLRNTSVVTLDNVNAFGNTPIRGYDSLSGTIYVPQNLIASYQSASNWSTVYGEGHVTFAKIEGSIYE